MNSALSAIYLDNHSTTAIDRRAADDYSWHGNPGSVDHDEGRRANNFVVDAREVVCRLVGASNATAVFTSGATESINIVLQGVGRLRAAPQLALTSIEHVAVIATAEAVALYDEGSIRRIQADAAGRVNLADIESACATGIDLLCVMAANNEVGTIYPIREIAEIANKYGVMFLCDATQAAGKIPLKFDEWGITFMALSAHKMYGPKGVGALIIKKGVELPPLMYGGHQEGGLRPGTLNVPGIVGFGEACRLRMLEMEDDEARIAKMRDRMQAMLLEGIPGLVVNGDQQNRLAGNLHISVPGIPNKAVIARVRHRLAISTGAACSSGVEKPSHVLQAMGLPEDVIEGALRIGIGKFNSDEEIDEATSILIDAVAAVRKAMG